MQSQTRFNRVPEKVPGGFGEEPGQVQQGIGKGSGEGPGGFGAEPGQVQQGSGEGVGDFGAEPGQVQQGSGGGSGEGSGEGVGGFRCRAMVRFNRVCGHLFHGNPAEVFHARFRKTCANKTSRLLGIPPIYLSLPQGISSFSWFCQLWH